jgi:hypothetical protein
MDHIALARQGDDDARVAPIDIEFYPSDEDARQGGNTQNNQPPYHHSREISMSSFSNIIYSMTAL